MGLPDALDSLSCMKEIAAVYLVGPEDVSKVVIENLRHLDTAIVLSLVKARSDYSPGGSITRIGAPNWTKQLEDVFSSFKGDISLPWEGRKPVTILAFSESARAGSGSQTLGPSSLRKSTMMADADKRNGDAVEIITTPKGSLRKKALEKLTNYTTFSL
jgi:hypothetical protein